MIIPTMKSDLCDELERLRGEYIEEQKFIRWHNSLSYEQKGDEFIKKLIATYYSDYKAATSRISQEALAIVLEHCRRYDGVRFISISDMDFVLFEGIKDNDVTGWPLSWRMIDELGISKGPGNGGQVQILFGILQLEESGTYDVHRNMKLGSYLKLHDISSRRRTMDNPTQTFRNIWWQIT